MTYGFDAAGFRAPRATEIKADLQAAIDNAFGSPQDYSRDRILGVLVSTFASTLGGLFQLAQAVYDARDPNNATGAQLEAIVGLRGITRNPATAARLPANIERTDTGDTSSAIVIPAGFVIRSLDDGSDWATSDTATIGVGETDVDVTLVAQVAAAQTQSANAVSSIVTPLAGIGTVTHDALPGATGSTAGTDEETDDELRLRWRAALTQSSSIYDAVAELDYVDHVAVLDNDTSATATIDGVSVAAHSFCVVVYPDIATANEEEFAGVIAAAKPAGIGAVGNQGPVDVDGVNIYWRHVTEVTVDVVVTLTVETNTAQADVEAGVEDVIGTHFAGLDPGEDVFSARVLSDIVRQYSTTQTITVTVDAGSSVAVAATEIATAGTVTVTATIV